MGVVQNGRNRLGGTKRLNSKWSEEVIERGVKVPMPARSQLLTSCVCVVCCGIHYYNDDSVIIIYNNRIIKKGR